jgi:putative ABC transport system permease protein
MKMIADPPRLAVWVLRLVLPADRYETIAGDLEETFRLDVQPHEGPRPARRWYWRQVLSLAGARLMSRRSPPALILPDPPHHRGDRMHGLRQDLRYAVRTLVKTPVFTLIAVATLALGIGANTAIFTLVNALLLKPLPFAQPDELMMVHLLMPDRDGGPGVFREMVWSYPKYEVFRDQQQVFSEHALFTSDQWSLTGGGEPERVRGEVVGARYLTTLGIVPAVGRDFTRDEDRTPGLDPIVLLGHALWQRRFGGNPNVLGEVVRLSGVPHTVVGVLPAGFRGLTGEAEAWVPLMTASAKDLGQKWSHSYYAVARRKPGVSAGQARDAVSVLGHRVDAAIPDPRGVSKYGATAILLHDSRVDPLIRRSALVLLGAVGFVLLIGCVNLASLVLARAATRQREIAIRMAIGATRGRLVRQFLTESLVLAGTGAMAGLGVAYGSLRLAGAMMPEAGIVLRSQTFGLTRVGMSLIDLDLTTLLFTLAVAASTAVLFGLLPAWHASRADVIHTMKASGAGSIAHGVRGFSLRNLLIVGETALALVLLVAAGLMLQSVKNLQRTSLGFEPAGLVTFPLSLPRAEYDEARSTRFFLELLERVQALPGVQSAAFGLCAPVSGGCNGTRVTFPGKPPVAPGREPSTGIHWASPDLFKTMGVQLVRGRTFTERDRQGQPKVVVINETAARTLFGGEDPIGQRVGLGQGGFHDGAEVVGIVKDVRYRAVEQPATVDMYVPLLQSWRANGILFVRSTLDPAALIPAVRREVQSLDRDLPVTNVKTMGARFGDATWRTRLSADLLGLFAGLALLLAAIGLYGVMAQSVEQRTREIGVRLALGAERRSIFRLVIGRALVIAAMGIGVGVGLSLLSMRFLETLLYEVRPDDPVTLGALAAGLLGLSLLASYVPARRATRIDPWASLRSD